MKDRLQSYFVTGDLVVIYMVRSSDHICSLMRSDGIEFVTVVVPMLSLTTHEGNLSSSSNKRRQVKLGGQLQVIYLSGPTD